jgi:SGNH hydrolase-like domain, acetyltransferase AlgX
VTRLRSALGNLALASASVLIGLLALEVGFRIVLHGRGGSEDGAEQQYLEFDERLGWHKRPGAEAFFRRREYVQRIRINSLGQRDRERVYDRRSGTFRILALGDSYLEGYTVPLEATVTQVLEARLNRPDCPAEVLNAGTTGYSTDQELVFFQNEGWRYDANLVALFFYYNDVEPILRDEYYGRSKPQFLIQDGPLHLKTEILPEPPRRKGGDSRPRDDGQKSALFAWVKERLLRGQPVLFNRLAALGLWPPISPDPPRHDLGVYRRTPPGWVDPAWVHMGRILEVFKEAVKERGARLVIVYIPNPMEISERSRDLTRLAYGMSDAEWDTDRVRRRLSKLAAREGIALVDLTASLHAVEGLVSGPYFDIDRHWNALGHRTAALELERRLRQEGFLPDCPPRP